MRLDILAPCATGGIISPSVVTSLDVEIICGAANNVLASDSVADALAARGILYVPDFLANAGESCTPAAGSLVGMKSRSRLKLTTASGGSPDMLGEAQRRGLTPLAIARERADERLARAETGLVPR